MTDVRGTRMDAFTELFDLIGELARRRYQAAERSFAVLGLNHTEARLLTLLDRAGGAESQEVLSSLVSVDRSNVGRALKGLEAAGLIERRKDDTDKRTNVVSISEAGRARVVEISQLRQEMATGFFGDMKADEAGEIVRTFRRALHSEESR